MEVYTLAWPNFDINFKLNFISFDSNKFIIFNQKYAIV